MRRSTSPLRQNRLLLGALTAASLTFPFATSQGVLAAGAGSLTPPCSNAALATSIGRGGVAAGTASETLLIKNRTSHTCTLSGTPATQFGNIVSASSAFPNVFRGVGPAATKLTYSGFDRGKTILVKPGAIASVTIGIETAADFPRAKCDAANASRVRLIFANGTALMYTLRKTAVCQKLASTITSGVVLGTRFP